ncbi:MAG: PhoH family protein [Thermodesulfobacteriota bacterium]
MVKTRLLERFLEFDDGRLANELFGPQGENLKRIGERCGISVQSRGSKVILAAEDDAGLSVAESVLVQLYGQLRAGRKVFPQDVERALSVLSREPGARLEEVFREEVFAVAPRRTVAPKSQGQRMYLESIRTSDLTFGIGPAGTGKTYLAVAMAVQALTSRQVQRLILTRPAVEAGEKLGFLPGDLAEKINPYLRPLYDALHDLLDFRRVQDMLATGVIEVAPLAFMRGRTLNEAFIILDEAQNTTPEQMKMFLTRLGFGSKAVVTGDVTQIDLPAHARSGLVQAEQILAGVEGVSFIRFNDADVIRHPLVGRIVQAYERSETAAARR